VVTWRLLLPVNNFQIKFELYALGCYSILAVLENEKVFCTKILLRENNRFLCVCIIVNGIIHAILINDCLWTCCCINLLFSSIFYQKILLYSRSLFLIKLLIRSNFFRIQINCLSCHLLHLGLIHHKLLPWQLVYFKMGLVIPRCPLHSIPAL